MHTGIRLLVAATAVALTATSVVHAQDTDYPTDTVRIVIPFSAGGGTDIMGRLLAQEFSNTWGQSVVVENRDGANGNLGTQYVARAANDGYTLLLTTNATIAINPQLFTDAVTYNPIEDFEPVTMVSSLPFVLVAHPSVEAESFEELIELARNNPGELDFGSSGAGGGAHLSGELLKVMGDIDIVHIPYPGSGPSIPALIGGHIDFMFVSILTAMPHIKEGTMKALAVTSPERSPALPDVPAVAEHDGFDGFEADLWYGMLVPAGTDPAIVEKVYEETHRVLNLPEVKERFEPTGNRLIGNTPEEFGAQIRSDIEKWSEVIEASGVRGEL